MHNTATVHSEGLNVTCVQISYRSLIALLLKLTSRHTSIYTDKVQQSFGKCCELLQSFNMAEKYALSEASANSLASILAQGQSAAAGGESADVYNLLAAGMSQMAAAIKAINQKLPDNPNLPLVVSLETVTKAVNLSCYKSTERSHLLPPARHAATLRPGSSLPAADHWDGGV